MRFLSSTHPITEGEWNAKVTMIISAHQLGLPMQTISELTGIDEDKILAVVQNSQ